MTEDWVATKDMADLLGLHRATLLRVKATNFVREGFHFVKKNPTSPRGDFIWHRHRTMQKFGRV